MTSQHTVTGRLIRCLESARSSMPSRAVVGDVQICEVPKLVLGVASTS